MGLGLARQKVVFVGKVLVVARTARKEFKHLLPEAPKQFLEASNHSSFWQVGFVVDNYHVWEGSTTHN